jgi:hypothetical protein
MLIVPVYVECRDEKSVEDAVDLLRSNGHPCFVGEKDEWTPEFKVIGCICRILRPITTPLVALRSLEEWEAAYLRGEFDERVGDVDEGDK